MLGEDVHVPHRTGDFVGYADVPQGELVPGNPRELLRRGISAPQPLSLRARSSPPTSSTPPPTPTLEAPSHLDAAVIAGSERRRKANGGVDVGGLAQELERFRLSARRPDDAMRFVYSGKRERRKRARIGSAPGRVAEANMREEDRQAVAAFARSAPPSPSRPRTAPSSSADAPSSGSSDAESGVIIVLLGIGVAAALVAMMTTAR